MDRLPFLSNAHTHSVYCDGKSTPEEMVQQALKLGFTSLGFSGHSYLPYENEEDRWTMSEQGTLEYIAEVRRLAEVYKDQIRIYCGLELDNFSQVDLTPFDYSIASVHMYYDKARDRYWSYDATAAKFKDMYEQVFDSDPLKLTEAYYEEVVAHARASRSEILGHFNLLTKFNKALPLIDENDPVYKKIAGDALLEAASYTTCVEINTGAMGRGYADVPYPNFWMMQLMHEHHIPATMTCDCHNAALLGSGYEASVQLLKEAGFTSLLILGQKDLFEEIAL